MLQAVVTTILKPDKDTSSPPGGFIRNRQAPNANGWILHLLVCVHWGFLEEVLKKFVFRGAIFSTIMAPYACPSARAISYGALFFGIPYYKQD